MKTRLQNNYLFTYDLARILHLDMFLCASLMILCGLGMIVLYSAASGDNGQEFRQLLRFSIAFTIMVIVAQIPPIRLKQWTPWLFSLGTVLLTAVLVIGVIGKGAQRWLNLGFFTFQPSEIMKLAMPMMIAWYLSEHPLPPRFKQIAIIMILLLVPVLLIAKQPDLGTAIMIFISGGAVLFLSGLTGRYLISVAAAISGIAPLLWYFLHDYQKQRVLTFLDPERDPLGNGYHIIQSKIAIGSGGIWGKGFLAGTQSHLDFLPEHATDFIFAVCGEEFGFIGCLVLLTTYLLITFRGFYIASRAQDTFSRLLAGSLSLTFFLSVFVNMGMVAGILPVVGIPLLLVSYGGTSMVTIMACFGILMSIHTHRNLVAQS